MEQTRVNIPRPQYTLRLAALAITVTCLVLAVSAYRIQVRRYDAKTERANLEVQLLVSKARAEAIKERIAASDSSWEFDSLPQFEADAAIAKIRTLGFVVAHDARLATRVSITAPAKKLSASEIDGLMKVITKIRASRMQTIALVDLGVCPSRQSRDVSAAISRSHPGLKVKLD